MKILFDEDVPRKLARSLPQHEIHTVVSMRWGGIKNGALLKLIERESFNVFLTGDKGMENQQRLEGRPLLTDRWSSRTFTKSPSPLTGLEQARSRRLTAESSLHV